MTNNYVISNNCLITSTKIIINGEQVPPVPGKNGNYNNITTINGNVYIDGYEFKNGRWKKTLKGLWHKWF